MGLAGFFGFIFGWNNHAKTQKAHPKRASRHSRLRILHAFEEMIGYTKDLIEHDKHKDSHKRPNTHTFNHAHRKMAHEYRKLSTHAQEMFRPRFHHLNQAIQRSPSLTNHERLLHILNETRNWVKNHL